jgi:hypothetical protein
MTTDQLRLALANAKNVLAADIHSIEVNTDQANKSFGFFTYGGSIYTFDLTPKLGQLKKGSIKFWQTVAENTAAEVIETPAVEEAKPPIPVMFDHVEIILDANLTGAAKMEPGYNSRGELTEVSIVPAGPYSIEGAVMDPAEPTIATEDPEPVDMGQPLTTRIHTADGFNFDMPATNPELRRNILAAQARNAAGKGASLAILGLPGQHSDQPETLNLRGLPAHLNSAMPEAIQAVTTQRQIAEAQKGISRAQAKLNSRRLEALAAKMQARPEIKRALELMETELGRMKEALIELTEIGVGHDVEYLGSLARAGAPFPNDWNMYVVRLREAFILDQYGNFIDKGYKALYMSKLV